ncbi:YihY/virulence factor BrkB family protein [Kineosporia sp. J2-2]|uniref:YihY/virulence factor BrkB family protein n=1 Tax=Kineosporia corallincola TaxID=2835133 RepID=A0ABS5TEQ9_9ACTN|nr:YhjD/YihY/BrkB family envelope integrity protein [Kineosporia corallincola]MBT0769547.1 YihY/virulence factor BrkB family protein [Kineosporia corallincola]
MLSVWSRVRWAVGRAVRDTRAGLAGTDTALLSAGATLYGALAAVPTLLVAVALAGVLFGRERIAGLGGSLAVAIPDQQGAGSWVRALFSSGLSLSPLSVLFAVFMASAYGRGLSRALVRLVPTPHRAAPPPSLKARLLTLPLLGLAPLMLLALLVITPTVENLETENGLPGVVAASYLGLNLVWVILWAPLAWMFRVVAPGRPDWRAAWVAAVVTAAFVSGFLQGFTLFLALPVDLGRPFGGLGLVGVTTALLLWLWVLHAVVCVGYALTWALDGMFGAGHDQDDRDDRRTADDTGRVAAGPASPGGAG